LLVYARCFRKSRAAGEYWGLSWYYFGEVRMILQLYCVQKLVLNPTEEERDKGTPSKGKTVTQEEYDEISKEKDGKK